MTAPQNEQSDNQEALSSKSDTETQKTSILSADQLLSALDAQMKFFTDGQRNEGLTRWAAWGALAALVWIGTDLIASKDLTMAQTVLGACSLFTLWMLLEQFVFILSPSSGSDVGPTRFRFMSDVVNSVRLEEVASALRHLLVLLAVLYFHFYGLWLLWAYTGLVFARDVSFFMYGMTTGLAVPTRINLRVVFGVMNFVSIICLVATGFQIGGQIWANRTAYTLADVRLALVFNAGFYLLIKLATASSSEQVLKKLIYLRQHIAFQRIPIQEANRQAEELLNGLSVEGVLNQLVKAISNEVSELHPMVDKFQILNKQAFDKISLLSEQTTWRKDQRDSLFAEILLQVDELELQASKITKKLKALKRASNRFALQGVIIVVYSPEFKSEVKTITDQARSVYDTVVREVTECLRKHAIIKAEVNSMQRP